MWWGRLFGAINRGVISFVEYVHTPEGQTDLEELLFAGYFDAYRVASLLARPSDPEGVTREALGIMLHFQLRGPVPARQEKRYFFEDPIRMALLNWTTEDWKNPRESFRRLIE